MLHPSLTCYFFLFDAALCFESRLERAVFVKQNTTTTRIKSQNAKYCTKVPVVQYSAIVCFALLSAIASVQSALHQKDQSPVKIWAQRRQGRVRSLSLDHHHHHHNQYYHCLKIIRPSQKWHHLTMAEQHKMRSQLAAQFMPFFWLIARILTFRNKKYHILTFHDKI